MNAVIEYIDLYQINQLAVKYREEQVFMCLNKFNLKQIKRLVVEINEQNIHLSKYLIELEEMADYFIKHYAVDNSMCFAVNKTMFRKIRKSYSYLIRLRFKFCPRSPYKKRDYLGERVSFADPSHSVLCGNIVQLDLFGKQSYPKLIQILCKSFACFFNTLSTCSNLCKDVLKTEKMIRDNPALCKKLYNADYQEILSNCNVIVKSYENILDFGVDILNGDSDEDIQNNYHKLTRKQMLAHVLHNEMRKRQECDIDEDERELFPNKSNEDISKVRYVIDNFDKMAVKGRGNHLASISIVNLAEYWHTENRMLKFYNYFKRKYTGIHEIPSYQSVNNVKNKHSFVKNSTGEENTKKFVEQLNKLEASYIPSSKTKTTQLNDSSKRIFAIS